MLLMGDSNAEMLVPAFTEIAERVGGSLSVAMRESCPWQQDLLFADFKHQDLCRAHHADWYSRVVPSLDPDVVVLINRTFDDPVSPAALDTPDGRVDPGSDELLHEVRRATERSLETFRDRGRKVVVIEPIPYAPRGYRPISCLSQASDVDECRYVASPGPMGVERVYRKAAGNDDGIWVLDMDRLVCPFLPICDPVIAGEIVKLDGGHLTATYARSISGDIEGYLKDNAIIDS
jgi:hypothetical protein